MAELGDENNSETMGQFIDHFRRIRNRQITIIFINYSGKYASKELRGHNSLKVAIDNWFLIEKKANTDEVTVKQKHCRNGLADQKFIWTSAPSC